MAQWWKNPPASAGGTGAANLIPGTGRFPGGRNGNPLQHSCLENSTERESWWATVRGIAESCIQLSEHSRMQFTQIIHDFAKDASTRYFYICFQLTCSKVDTRPQVDILSIINNNNIHSEGWWNSIKQESSLNFWVVLYWFNVCFCDYYQSSFFKVTIFLNISVGIFADLA